jgi:hypothetical protein
MSKYITELANDIAKSCPDLVENGCGNDNCVACLAFKLTGLGYQKQEWISVEERLPDCEQGAESKAVLFITKQGFMYTGYYGCGGIYRDRYFREYKNSTEGYDISNVTHWMPLPEPPSVAKMKGGAE